jgi:hypothetical protein
MRRLKSPAVAGLSLGEEPSNVTLAVGSDAIGHLDIEKTTLSAVLPVAYTTRTGAGNITRGT